jgi:hypothetical protein
MSTKIDIALRTALSLAVALTLSAAPAFADSVDGNPLDRIDRKPSASAHGSPAILFEGHGGPLDACMSDDGSAGTSLCGVGGGF